MGIVAGRLLGSVDRHGFPLSETVHENITTPEANSVDGREKKII